MATTGMATTGMGSIWMGGGIVIIAGAGMSKVSCMTTSTRPSMARASTSQPSSVVCSRIVGLATVETSMTVTFTCGCQVWCHHDKAETPPLVSASAVPTGVQVFSCEITVSRVPCRNSERSQPGVVMWLTTPNSSAGQALTMSTPSPASTKRCSPSVLTRSPSSTPAT